MLQVPVHEAKTHLSRLLAAVERGEEVVIMRDRTPVARLVAFEEKRKHPVFGDMAGQIGPFPDEAFAPMTDEEAEEWGF
jgi:prevent-host-death family protein